MGILGILRAGGALVPLDPAHPAERLALLLEDSGPAVVVAQAGAAGERPRLPFCWKRWRTRAGPIPRSRRTALAYVIYTSGSTGRPKGVGVSHANIVPMLRWSRETFGLDAGAAGAPEPLLRLRLRPLGDPDGASSRGRRCTSRRWRRPATRRPSRGGPSPRGSTPSTPRRRSSGRWRRRGRGWRALRVLHLGGEALSRTAVERLAAAVGEGCTLYNGYGPTEVTVNSLLFEIGRPGAPAGRRADADRPAVGGERGLRGGPPGRRRCRWGCPGELLGGRRRAWRAATWAGRS